MQSTKKLTQTVGCHAFQRRVLVASNLNGMIRIISFRTPLHDQFLPFILATVDTALKWAQDAPIRRWVIQACLILHASRTSYSEQRFIPLGLSWFSTHSIPDTTLSLASIYKSLCGSS